MAVEFMDPKTKAAQDAIVSDTFWGEAKKRLIPIAADVAGVGIAATGIYFGYPVPGLLGGTAVAAAGNTAAALASIGNDTRAELNRTQFNNLSYFSTEAAYRPTKDTKAKDKPADQKFPVADASPASTGSMSKPNSPLAAAASAFKVETSSVKV